MSDFVWVVYAAMALLALVLGVGLWTMLKGGHKNKSQRMMRWRLAIQALLIILVAIFVFYFNKGA